jgi:hypothetical protein
MLFRVIDKTTMFLFRVTMFALSVVNFLLSATTLFRVLDKTTMFFPWHHVCSSVVNFMLSSTTLFRVFDKTTYILSNLSKFSLHWTSRSLSVYRDIFSIKEETIGSEEIV